MVTKTSKSEPGKYAALLRGINVGGKMVKMSDLKAIFEGLGFVDVRTLLNSGNVLFSLPKKAQAKGLAEKIEKELQKKLNLQIDIIVRPISEIEKIAALQPFAKIKTDKNTRLYVTFYASAIRSKSNLKIPYVSPGKEFRILKITDKEVFSVLQLSDAFKTPESMAIIEKEFGKKGATTRNWNTVVRLLK